MPGTILKSTPWCGGVSQFVCLQEPGNLGELGVLAVQEFRIGFNIAAMGFAQTLQFSRKGRQSAFGGQEVPTNFLGTADAAGIIPIALGGRKNSSLLTFASFAIFA